MISLRRGSAFIIMRMPLSIAGLLAIVVFFVACWVQNEDLGPQFAPPTPAPVTGGCVAEPRSLVQIPNLLAAPFAILPGLLYVVMTETPGDTANETIWQVPLAGGAPKPVATGQANIMGFDGDALGDLVWTSGGADDAGAGGAVWTLDSSGSPAVLVSNRAVLGPIHLDYGVIYWVEEGIDPGGQIFGAIMQGSSTTPGAEIMMFQKTDADQIPRGFGFLDGAFAWTTRPPADGGARQSALVTAPNLLPFGAQTEIAGPDGGGVAHFAPADTQLGVFYSTASGIMAVSPPDVPRLLLPLSNFVDGMLDQERILYFTLPPVGNLWAVADDEEAGAAPIRQLTYDGGPGSEFAIDSACVYWVDAVGSRVMMVQK